MKVCDRCRKEIKHGKKVLGADLCETCVNHIKEWIKKPVKKGLDLSNLAGVFGGNN